MTYQTVSAFAQSWGLVFLVVMFSRLRAVAGQQEKVQESRACAA